MSHDSHFPQPHLPKHLMKAAFEDLLSHEPVVRVVLINHSRLEVPEGVRPKAMDTVTLEYGLNLPVPIDDLEITDSGIRATLSFSRTSAPTFVPWEAVVDIGLSPRETTATSDSLKNRPKLSLVS
jgi:hypothetical protein